ncbi:MAG TPA: exo-alpha-sialidase [Flavobacteriia bacterium]|nr:exo-alpha-sialidase [Flavobacteriia bacterium]
MRSVFTTWLLVFLFVSCKAQKKTATSIPKYTNVKIFEQSVFQGLGPCEPSIFINPLNTNNIVAGSVIDFVHTSFDGGKSWNTKNLTSKFGIWGDPSVIADFKGNFYYFHLSDPEGTNWQSTKVLDRMVVQKSTDGGVSWSNGAGIGHNSPKQQDKEWAAVNTLNNEIYLTWTEFDKYGSKNSKHHSRILFSKSADEGKTWSQPKILSQVEGNAIDDNGTVEGAVPAVGLNGEIYCAWSVNDKIYFDKSMDGGISWLKEDVIATTQKGWGFEIEGFGRANGMPVTAVDLSKSKYKGTIYINFADKRNGKTNSDVFLIKSADNGKTWSKPTKVNQDNTETEQFFTWMSVDPKTGFIYIVYYDRSNYKDTKTDVVLAVSKDGGKTFNNTTISDKPFTPNPKIFFGDYNNICAFDGVIRPIWTSYEKNKLSVWTCLISEK